MVGRRFLLARLLPHACITRRPSLAKRR